MPHTEPLPPLSETALSEILEREAWEWVENRYFGPAAVTVQDRATVLVRAVMITEKTLDKALAQRLAEEILSRVMEVTGP